FGAPSMVVLDEPNSNLDAAGEQALTDAMLRAKQMGITIVVITQRPALLNIVDKVLILRSGRGEAFGPPRDVLRRLLNANGAQPGPQSVPGLQARASRAFAAAPVETAEEVAV